jgi:hypothetical protein
VECRGFDGQVARQDDELRSLCARFVCVRLVKMNSVDLAQFQFDYDMTWAALFLHPDGTVFARYGSRTAEDPMALNSVRGLAATMRRVLDAHAAYPANRELFAPKRGPAPRFRRPEDMPALAKRSGARVDRASCIHCHEVHEAMHDVERREHGGPAKVFKYPLPESLGLVLDPESGDRVASVLPRSAAERAGVRPGDALARLGGQAVLSIADAQFVLHHLEDAPTVLPARLRRGDAEIDVELRLEAGWQLTDFTWRTSMKGFPPDPGLYLRSLDPEERRGLGIAASSVALEVRALFTEPPARSGLRKGDVIVEYDGRREVLSALRFDDYLRLHHFRPGSEVQLKVLRGGKVEELAVRLR